MLLVLLLLQVAGLGSQGVRNVGWVPGNKDGFLEATMHHTERIRSSAAKHPSPFLLQAIGRETSLPHPGADHLDGERERKRLCRNQQELMDWEHANKVERKPQYG